MTVPEYRSLDESLDHEELHYGTYVREPAPTTGHQRVAFRLSLHLYEHVLGEKLGEVLTAPLDVVLDRQRALVVQPDIIFISTARAAICQDIIEGAPDLVVEVLSPGTRRRDSLTKLAWYRQYGVRECWLVDEQACAITVCDADSERRFERAETIVSSALPGLRLRPDTVL